MKKIISLMLIIALVASMAIGCTKQEPAPTPEPETPPTTEEPTTEEPAPVEAGSVAKLGLGQNIGIGKSSDATAEKPASAQADVTMAAVGFDAEGKVASVTVDVVQAKVAFDADLKITSDLEADVRSKKDLGPEYGMTKASEIGKDWFEQMAAFEEWMIGKTVEEIKSLPVKERDESHKNVPDVPELTSSVTITVESYIAAVEEAWANAVDAPGAEKVGLGVKAGIGSSKEKGTDANGKEILPQAQADVYMSATAVDAEGKVVATLIDTAQVKVAFDAEGKLTTDKAGEFKTKQELKEEYGMVKASAIGKEWFEQMAAFQEWMQGKTSDEITGLAVKEANPTHQHVPDVPELESSVTITVEGYQAVVAEAIANAR